LSSDEDAMRHDVAYLRFLKSSGLSEAEIREIAQAHSPHIEVCFSEEECLAMADRLEKGKHLVLIS